VESEFRPISSRLDFLRNSHADSQFYQCQYRKPNFDVIIMREWIRSYVQDFVLDHLNFKHRLNLRFSTALDFPQIADSRSELQPCLYFLSSHPLKFPPCGRISGLGPSNNPILYAPVHSATQNSTYSVRTHGIFAEIRYLSLLEPGMSSLMQFSM
jgi:hypothetical protein